MPKFTEETILGDIVEVIGAEEILAKYNLPCLTCPMARFEMEKLKIGQVCRMYKLDLDNLLKELNEKYGKETK